MCIPFAGLLLSVALMPIFLPEWWEKHEKHVIAAWGIIVLIMMYAVFGATEASEVTLDCIFNDYLTFIVLLFGLYCVAGNIHFEGDLAGSPRVNVILLAVGAILSSLIGTTGSSMLMVRPIIKMNSWRRHKAHVMIFFIFIISNLGGCLTPMGDPPLLIGYMRGVPFFWSLRLFPVFLFNLVILLLIFRKIDEKRYREDIAEGYRPDISTPGTELLFSGKHNIVFLIMIVIGVLLSGTLPKLSAFQDADGNVLGINLPFGVTFSWPSVIEVVIILLAAFLSFKTTNKSVRKKNHFTWGAITEVACLFAGIFITMQPALLLLKTVGPNLGLTEAWQMFWTTGALSSFLDNTPTYLVFLTTAGTLGFTEGITTTLGTVSTKMLMAISCGAVFMGANTYIGNAPNLMVKTLSDENGISMPSFFGYMKWSVCILIPVFLLDTLVFFL